MSAQFISIAHLVISENNIFPINHVSLRVKFRK